VTDIEFIVQYLVLREASNNPDLIRYSDNIRQLEALSKSEILAADDAEILADAYREYRRKIHRLALAGKPRLVRRSDVKTISESVTEIWRRVFA